MVDAVHVLDQQFTNQQRIRAKKNTPMETRPKLSVSHMPPSAPARPLDADLRGFLETNRDVVTRIVKPVSLDHIAALSAQSEQPILFENIIERPGYRLCDILVKHRPLQGRALGTTPGDFLRTLAYRLRQPPRGFVPVTDSPVKEKKFFGKDIVKANLPVPFHTDRDDAPYVTAINIIKDPETGFYNSSQAGTSVAEPGRWLVSFATPHSHAIMRKYRELGHDTMPMALVIGLPPAYEIMANFSGLHMDMWGEMEMVGTLMDQDIPMVPCETIDLTVPAVAEIVIEGRVRLAESGRTGEVTAATMHFLPHDGEATVFEVTAITMRADRPIYRNHQTCPDTDHQPLARLCSEAMIYNRLTELGLKVHDVRFPSWGGSISCVIQVDYPRPGYINDALMSVMGAPWLCTKSVIAVSSDTDIESSASVYHALATRCDPARDIFIVPGTRGSLYDPSALPLDGHYPFRLVGKMGIDATRKSRHSPADFDRAWPKHWGEVNLSDYVS